MFEQAPSDMRALIRAHGSAQAAARVLFASLQASGAEITLEQVLEVVQERAAATWPLGAPNGRDTVSPWAGRWPWEHG